MGLRKALKPYFMALAVLSLPSAAGFNMFLMSRRPVIAGLQTASSNQNILCGRINGQIYCVKITDLDLIINSTLDVLALFTVVPCLIFVAVAFFASKVNDGLDLDR